MRAVYWALLLAVLIAALALFLGVTVVLVGPILGVLIMIALLLWLLHRKRSRESPPG